MLKKKILSALLTIVMVLCASGLSGVYAASSVTWEDISNGQLKSNVIGDLNLITTIDETDVTWTSSKPHCVATDGTVTRWEEDEAVTLVAHRGNNTDTFNIIVTSYKSGDVEWDESKLASLTSLSHQYQWLGVASADTSLKDGAVATLEWKYDEENDLIYPEKEYGRWDAGYALTVNGNKYTWLAGTPKTLQKNGVAYDPLSVEFTADITTYSGKTATTASKTYTFYYLDEELTDAEGKACRVGFFKNSSGNPSGGWTSLYMKDENSDGALEVDTSYDYSVAVTGYMKPDLTPIIATRRPRAHLNFVNVSGYPSSSTEADETKRARYEQFSFRYRQKLDEGQSAPNSAQHFTFFYNNQSFALDAAKSIGADDSAAIYYGGVPKVYYDLSDTTKTASISKAGSSGTEFVKLGSADSALEVKTTDEGLTGSPTFTLPANGTWSAWREVVMKTDKSECTTVMYIDGKPVYWKVTVSGQTYYSPFLVHNNYTSGSDGMRTGFSEPHQERLFVNFQVDSVKLERMTQAEYDDAELGAVVNSFDGENANFTFKRAGKYKVFFVDYEGGRLENVTCIETKKTKGQVTNMPTGDATKTWDKILVWGAGDSLKPLMDAVNTADLTTGE